MAACASTPPPTDLTRDLSSLKAQISGLKSEQTERGWVLTLRNDALFDSGSSTLKPGVRRAAAVKRALVDRGIEPSRIDSRGYGPAFPVASNETPTGRQQNRRVEIIINPS